MPANLLLAGRPPISAFFYQASKRNYFKIISGKNTHYPFKPMNCNKGVLKMSNCKFFSSFPTISAKFLSNLTIFLQKKMAFVINLFTI